MFFSLFFLKIKFSQNTNFFWGGQKGVSKPLRLFDHERISLSDSKILVKDFESMIPWDVRNDLVNLLELSKNTIVTRILEGRRNFKDRAKPNK